MFIPRLTVSVIDFQPQELCVLSIDSLSVGYAQSDVNYKFNLSVGGLQLDNQLHGAMFPVVIATSMMQQPEELPQSASNGTGAWSFFNLRIVKSNDIQDLHHFKYFAILMQEVCISVEEAFLRQLIDMFEQLFAPWRFQANAIRLAQLQRLLQQTASLSFGSSVNSTFNSSQSLVKASTSQHKMLYFDHFEISTIVLDISFLTSRISHSRSRISTFSRFYSFEVHLFGYQVHVVVFSEAFTSSYQNSFDEFKQTAGFVLPLFLQSWLIP
jgi:vacuolar protein sorting-associated protein 13A/C